MRRLFPETPTDQKQIQPRHTFSGLFGNFVKFTFRKIKTQKGLSFLNIAGLTVGMACFIILALWIQDEKSYDNFHEHGDRIFRIVSEMDGSPIESSTSWRLAPFLKGKIDEIEDFCRIRMNNASLIEYGNRRQHEQNYYLADPSLFQLFSFPFTAGDSETALSRLDSIVITKDTANRYFGKDNPLGKKLYVLQFNAEFEVTGVIENIPRNSHIQFDLISRIEWMGAERMDSWEPSGFTYVKLFPSADLNDVNRKLVQSVQEIEDQELLPIPILQSLTRVHLFEARETGSGKKIYLFSILAAFILILACINFTNMSTARSIKTAKEVGIRKVIGASRSQIFFSFLGEHVILSALALFSSLSLVAMTLPAINRFLGTALKFSAVFNVLFVLVLIGLVSLTSILSGSYPAVFLSSFRPSRVLKGKFNLGTKGLPLRRILITFQFSVAIGFIICSLIVHKQLRLIKEKDLGFNRDSIVVVSNNEEIMPRLTKFKERLLEEPDILNVTASSSRPILVRDEVNIRLEGKSVDDSLLTAYSMVDFDFFETFGMEIVRGRPFSEKNSEDRNRTCVINESAARELGLDYPVGTTIYFDHPDFSGSFKELVIIGVVKDFHFRSMHQAIGPFVFRYYRPWHFSIFLRIKPGSIQDTLDRVESIYREFSSHHAFYYEFLDDSFQEIYLSEIQQGYVFSFFGVVAILISCLGLFGLASYSAEQKTKEIGIRKVFGATVPRIVFSLMREFSQGVLMANLITWPIAYFVMSRWLRNFAYRTNIGLDVFIASALLTLFTALLTVVFRAVRAASANPVEPLRYE